VRHPIRAILFDFDGVIGDTIGDNFAAWQAAFAAHGVTADRTECCLLEGKKTAELAAEVLSRRGKDPGLGAEIGAAKDAHYRAHNRFSFYPGVERLIPDLQRRGYKIGVVSGGMLRRLLTPATEPFLKTFDAIVTGDECSRGKPDPEPFLRCAEKLGIPPERCLVVENAPLGVAAAKRAGMRCLAVTTSLSAEHLREADAIIERTTDVVQHLD
jgi:HAD superfamily hydrolase (TIGR01509 family)